MSALAKWVRQNWYGAKVGVCHAGNYVVAGGRGAVPVELGAALAVMNKADGCEVLHLGTDTDINGVHGWAVVAGSDGDLPAPEDLYAAFGLSAADRAAAASVVGQSPVPDFAVRVVIE